MIPTISVEYETNNKGAEKLILSLLDMSGILEVTSQEGTNDDVKGLKMSDYYKEQHIVIVGDVLYQICARTINELIE